MTLAGVVGGSTEDDMKINPNSLMRDCNSVGRRTPTTEAETVALLKQSIQNARIEKLKELLDKSDRAANLRVMVTDLVRCLTVDGNKDSLDAVEALAVVTERLLEDESDLSRAILSIEWRLDPATATEAAEADARNGARP